MIKNTLYILNVFRLSILAEFLLNFYSKLVGNDYKFKFLKPFWSVKTKFGHHYVDYLIDPRQSQEEDVYDLYKDIFFHKYTPKKGDVICDVGAGMGHELPIFIDAIGRDGSIFLIEASPSTYNGLNHSVKLNELTNTQIFNLAISDSNQGHITISDDIENHLGRSILDKGRAKGSYKEVKQITIDKFIQDNAITKIDFMVINIEGFEKHITRKFDAIQCVKNIAISCHDFLHIRDPMKFDERYKTYEIVKKFLEENGFNVCSRSTGKDFKDFYLYGSR